MGKLIPLPMHRKTIREQVAGHPLLAFSVLAYGISWMAWFLMDQINLGEFNGFGLIGAMGPALAAMIVSALIRPEASEATAEKRWALFGILSCSLFVSLFMRRLWLTTELTTISGRVVTQQIYPSFAVFLLDVLAAAVAASVFSGIRSKRQGIRHLLRSFNLRQNQPRWYWFVIALMIYPIVVLLGNAISTGFGLPVPASKAVGPWYLLILDVVLAFVVTFFGGGGLEEPGWRGFALPLLQQRYSPLRSSLVLAIIWAFWHWPMFWFGYYDGGLFGVLFFIVGCIPIAILFTAVFHWTKGSLPVMILLHTSINITPSFLPVASIASGLWWLLILCVVLWMWRSPQAYLYREI